MRLRFALLLLVGTSCAFGAAAGASASPITLICSGTIAYQYDGAQKIIGESAILDIDAGTFKPPLYDKYPLIAVEDSSVSFAGATKELSTSGTLDRISGTLEMNIMTPEQRIRLKAGQGATFLAWITGRCAPAKRIF